MIHETRVGILTARGSTSADCVLFCTVTVTTYVYFKGAHVIQKTIALKMLIFPIIPSSHDMVTSFFAI